MAWYRTNAAATNPSFVNEAGTILAVTGTAPSQTITMTMAFTGAVAQTLSSPGGNAVYTTTAAALTQLLKIIDEAERYAVVDASTL